MRQKNHNLRSVILIAVIIACIIPIARFSHAVELRIGNMNADRILFLGNSLTYHWPNSDLGWSGSWGMAATSADKDYAHRVVAAVAELNGGVSPAMKAVNVYNYGQYEKNYAGYDVTTQMAELLAWNPDIVVVELGENVTDLTTTAKEAQFAKSFANLLTTFKNNGQTNVFVRNLWYPDAAKDAIMKQATADVGCVWVNLGDLESNILNRSESQGVFTGAVGSHPSDQGMQAIADGLVKAMKTQGVPEPSMLAMLAVASVCCAGMAGARWMGRSGDGEYGNEAIVSEKPTKSE
jgi:alpha-galactosidase